MGCAPTSICSRSGWGGGGGSSTGVGRGIAVRIGGTTIVTDNFYSTARSGATRLAAAGSFDVFVARIGAASV